MLLSSYLLLRDQSQTLEPPVVTSVGYTSAYTTTPDGNYYPSGVAYLALQIKKTTEVAWTTYKGLLLPNTRVSITDPYLTQGVTYQVRWATQNADSSFEGQYTAFSVFSTPNDVSIGLPQATSTDCFDLKPERPAPVTLRNHKSTSVGCVYNEQELPVRSSTTSLLFKKRSDSAWSSHVSSVIPLLILNVTSLEANTEYEFKFVSTNSSGSTDGPTARYTTRALTDGAVPLPPTLSTPPCPDGQESIIVQWPEKIGSSVYSQLYIATSNSQFPLWTKYGTPIQNVEEDVLVEGLLKNKDYYFRVIQFNEGHTVEYTSPTTHIKTLPGTPEEAEPVTLSRTGDDSVLITLPEATESTEWFNLQKGEGETEEDIEWLEEWKNLSPGEEFIDVLLEEDVVYWYRAVNHNRCGQTIGKVVYTDTYTELPEVPGIVTFKNVFATRFDVLREFSYPARTSNLTLYLVTGSSKEVVKQNLSKNQVVIPIREKSPNTNYRFVYGASNQKGEVFGDEAAVVTRLVEEVLPPNKPLPPTYLGDATDYEVFSRVVGQTTSIKSPIWEESTSSPVEGLELWHKYGNEEYALVGEYVESEEVLPIISKRGIENTFKVRAFNTLLTQKQYSEFSEELEIDLSSKKVKVEITNPEEDDLLSGRVKVQFKVEDIDGHTKEELYFRGYYIAGRAYTL